jgi:hypothetical protein
MGGENKAHGTSNFASISPKGRRNVEQIVGEREAMTGRTCGVTITTGRRGGLLTEGQCW